MSNYYAIATVTATLQQLLDKAVSADVAGASATMTRPDSPAVADPGVNVFLYQVTPNAAWRNEDLPTRSAEGRLRQRPRAAIDLHYLLTFNGADDKFEPHLALGSAVRELHVKPVLTAQEINDARATYPALANSNLSSEVERVKFTQLPLTLEELSKLWSVFFQAKYQLSVAYQGTVVLIEPDDVVGSPLPVQARNLYVALFREPRIEAIVAASGDLDPIIAGADVRIRGERLSSEDGVVVVVDGIAATTGSIADGEIVATLPVALHAGVHAVVVRHPRKLGTPAVDHVGVTSNVAPFVLVPKIRGTGAGAYDITLSGQTSTVIGGVTVDSADIVIDLDPVVDATERALLLLDELVDHDAHAYVFPASVSGANTVTAHIANVVPGDYLVRVQVEGATSLPTPDATGARPQATL